MSYNAQTGMYEGYIYKITNRKNGHMYIGQTMRTIEIRWKEHVKYAMAEADEYYFHRAIRLYKEHSFSVEQVDVLYAETPSKLKRQLNKSERYYINIFNTYNPHGYNGVLGGEGSSIRAIDYYSLDREFVCQFDSMTAASEFTGLSMTSITENCKGDSSGTRCGFFRYAGDPLDKFETLYKYNGAIKINKFSIDGAFIRSYKSCSEVADDYGVSRRIASRWKDKHVLIDNEFVLFLDTEEFDYNKITIPLDCRVDVFDLDGNYIRTFNSQSEAGRILHIDGSAISKCCLGKVDHVKSFIFRKHTVSL